MTQLPDSWIGQSASPASHLTGAEASYPTAEMCGSFERIRRCWLRSSVNLPMGWQKTAGLAYEGTMPMPAAVEVVDRYRIPIRRNPERIEHEGVIGTVGCVQIWVVVAALREVVLQRSNCGQILTLRLCRTRILLRGTSRRDHCDCDEDCRRNPAA
jgi:hypothetical protein